MEGSNKPSGLPRPTSKLPVLNKRSSQLFPKPTEPAKEPSKPPQPASRLQKRSSIATLPRASHSTIAGLKEPASAHSSSSNGLAGVRAPTQGTLRGLPRPGSTVRGSSARPSSRGNQQRTAFPSFATKPGAARLEDEENEDRLTSLDGFRTASRQGTRDSEETSPVESQDPSDHPLDEELFRPKDRKTSRPSLSDRTIESLQSVSTPQKGRRQSSFFTNGETSPTRPPSAMSRNASGGSNPGRPGTSDGSKLSAREISPVKKAPASARPATRVSAVPTPGSFGFGGPMSASAKRRSVNTTFTADPKTRASSRALPAVEGSPSPSKRMRPVEGLAGGGGTREVGSKRMAARPTKAKAGVEGTFKKPLHPARPTAKSDDTTPAAVEPPSAKAAAASSSSSALRQQIAAAKAAAKKEKEKAKHDSPQLQDDAASFGAFDSNQHPDPFNTAPKDEKHMLKQRIKIAWTSGKLNIAGIGLKSMPEEVLGMYDSKAMEEGKANWAEVVDLTRMIAADNEFTELPTTMFPDLSIEEMEQDEESMGSPFGGLEMLDLHGNRLQTLPMGLRRLERLTSLNLSHNGLDISCLDLITQIPTLRELKLGHNNLSGHLSASLCTSLPHLETLDLQNNKLLALPETLRELTSLRILNVSNNQLTALPMEALQNVPLIELDASNNALIASLFPLGGVNGHPTLQTLRVANNSLAALTFSASLDLPAVKTLDVRNNHLTVLPADLSSCMGELLELFAGENKIPELPEGFTGLKKLRRLDLSGNDLRVLEPGIARMEGLESLVLHGNPLRERKFLTMSVQDIKRVLRGKMEPAEIEELNDEDGEVSDPETVIGLSNGPAPAKLKISGKGVLDLSSKGLTDEDVEAGLGPFLAENDVRELYLQGNQLTRFPCSAFSEAESQGAKNLRVLDLSRNPFTSDSYLFLPPSSSSSSSSSSTLHLPALQTLSLSSNRLTTLSPLLTHLSAPRLQTLDLSANRLTGPLPLLRRPHAFPNLSALLARDNRFSARLDQSMIEGLATVNLSCNDLEALDPGIGLLWCGLEGDDYDEGVVREVGEGGGSEGGGKVERRLRHLDVGSNAFRVPGIRVLERGTEGLCRWLRERMPDPAAAASTMGEQ
ncbi:L domain-like protein [Hortaea werneckii]|nr:L domain-like protein [Hortaea werneckii]